VRRLALARELAVQHGASVTALYASTPAVLSVPFAMTDGASGLLPVLQQIDTDRHDAARVVFDRTVAGGAPPVRWRELGNDPLIPGVVAHALSADLLVFGQHDRAEPASTGVPPDFIESVLIGSGRPGLVVPFVDIGSAVGQNILIAWKATREAARALSAALPFLHRAQRIHLVAEPGGAAGGADDVLDYLQWHGVKAPVQRHGAVSSQTPGEGLLSLGADLGADLLVMGCYGHSRAREMVLGGASRTVLDTMTLPVLMSH
jgi:nucleotide-binding universal stress UspA family protein